MKSNSFRIFFAAGSGNVINAHKNWQSHHNDPSQMSITFSSEFASACRELEATAYIVSSASPPNLFRDGAFTIEHRPKAIASGLKYHIMEILYGLGLIKTAVQFRSNYAVLQSGSTHYFVMSLFRLFGIKVIPIMHNTLWPAGFPPVSHISGAVLFLDSLFFRWAATATLCVSPECIRQVHKITGGKHRELLQFNAQYVKHYFQPQSAPPDVGRFRLLFAGRIIRNKGVFDLLEIMKQVEDRMPGRATLTICGSGPDWDLLKSEATQMDLGDVVSIRGWVDPRDLRKLLIDCNAAIVPTRSDFAEGLPLAAIEGILIGRPVITNSVTSALEVLGPACLAAQTNNPTSYADAIIRLIEKPDVYQKLVKECGPLQAIFFDRSRSSEAMLKYAIQQNG
jgi:glycogen(starch) synthase